jgi:hypothetical protein
VTLRLLMELWIVLSAAGLAASAGMIAIAWSEPLCTDRARRAWPPPGPDASQGLRAALRGADRSWPAARAECEA